MVACSPLVLAAEETAPVEGRAALGSKVEGEEAGGVGRAGSGVEGEFGPVWFGFHMIAIVSFPLCVNGRSLPGIQLRRLCPSQRQPQCLEQCAVPVVGRIVRMWFSFGRKSTQYIVKSGAPTGRPLRDAHVGPVNTILLREHGGNMGALQNLGKNK